MNKLIKIINNTALVGCSGSREPVQPMPTNKWTKFLGSDSKDYSRSVATASDGSGSVYITGYTFGNLDGNINNGSLDAFLTKYNSDGEIQWTKVLGTNSVDVSRSVATASDGSVYITGYTDGELDGQTNNGDNEDIFLTKYNSNGEKQWTKLLGSPVDDRSYGVATASDGSVYITGNTKGELDSVANSGKDDAFLTKYSSNGEIIWTALLGNSEDNYSQNIATASDGSVYITGFTKGNLDEVPNSGNYDAFLTKYNSNGTKQWTVLFGTSFNDYSYGVATSSDGSGSVYITGYTEKDSGSSNAFLTKYNSDGEKQWTKLLGSIENDYSYGVATTSDGSVYITGSYGNDTIDVLLARYNSEGEKLWSRLLDFSTIDFSVDIASSSDDSLYITGYTNAVIDGDGDNDIYNLFLAKYMIE